MKGLIFSLGMITSLWCSAQTNGLGIFESQVDVGKPKLAGSANFDAQDQHYDLSGGGYNIWFNRDEFHYVYKKVKGDFILSGQFALLGTGVDPHRKTGWMVRASDQEDAAHMTATVHGDGLTVLQWRRLRGAYMRDPQDELFAPKKAAQIIELERSGKTFIMRVANPGEPLQEIGRTSEVDMPDEVLVGVFVCSHNPEVVEKARAWNLRITKPAPEGYNAYRQGRLFSRLEIMDLATLNRKVIHVDSVGFEAPNWMPGGQKLLFNHEGSIYTIPISGGVPEKLNTGIADRNNNDHVISKDGKWLGISHHRSNMPGGGSTVYYLPIGGGDPVMVTDSTPSYLHSWSPDGKDVIYTAQRLSQSPAYNIYKKPVKGGPEVRLTQNDRGLADGPEYSPDGKYIYYNANLTGTMQVWRMKSDGKDPEQITFDEYNNWFPHISPDGKWIVIISFPPDIDPGDHPFYKHVMLRLMPASGGAPRVIAHLYGGQGTINTPSWSPDSKYLAFVSN